jgi:dolichol kinase
MSEIARRFSHLFFGTLIAFLIYFDSYNRNFFIVLTILGIILSFIAKRTDIFIISWLLKKFDRREDRIKFPGKGAIFMSFGILISYVIFAEFLNSRMSAFVGAFLLGVGDSLSHLFGILIGRRRHILNPNKFAEGTIASILITSALLSLFINPLKALIITIVVLMFEVVEIRAFKARIDDNLIIPVFGAFLFYLLENF